VSWTRFLHFHSYYESRVEQTPLPASYTRRLVDVDLTFLSIIGTMCIRELWDWPIRPLRPTRTRYC
jgi:hypothetical protein